MPTNLAPVVTTGAAGSIGAGHAHEGGEQTTGVLIATLASSLTACGGSGGGSNSAAAAATAAPPVAAISDFEAARFLAQAAMGANRTQIARVQELGYAAWLDEQIAMAQSTSRWDWLLAKGYDAAANRNGEAGFDACAWRKLIASPDTLRQRLTLALSEILVVGIDGTSGGWRAFAAAGYLDLLEAQAFGNYRSLLDQVTANPAMGEWLSFRGNLKANASTGSLPDENYARELLQLFTIGLVQLNNDGTPRLVNGAPQATYGQDDIMGLARVFTGWDWDLAGGSTATPDFQRRPMALVASRHESGAKSFLGSTVAAGTDGTASRRQALDTIFAHPNVGPFIARQLIQRLVTSNPSAPYVGRIATVFNNDGSGVRGNLAAVVKALLLDDEARNPANVASTTFGKLREPILRFTAWARAWNAASASDAWAVGSTADPTSRLGQSPLRSPSVFNFFRPGYVPPNSAVANAGLVSPEMQITDESSVVGYVNFMQRTVSLGVGDVRADYATLLPLADNAKALLDEINLLLAAGQLSAATLANFTQALATLPSGNDTARNNRIYAALTLVLAAPEFIVLK